MIDKLYRVFQKNGINIAKDDFVYGLTNLIHWLTFIMILIPESHLTFVSNNGILIDKKRRTSLCYQNES